MSNIEPELMDLLRAALEQPLPDLTSNTDLIDELSLESIQVMDFIAEVEDHYDIIIEVDRLATVRTIADMSALVTETLG
jgi:acyl carrier protein